MQIVQRKKLTNVSGTTLRPLPGSPTLATSWFAGFVRPRSPLSCQCTSLCIVDYSFSATSRATTSIEQWTYPQRKRRVNKSSSRSLRFTRTSLPTWTRWCLLTHSEWLPSLSSVKQPTRRLAFSRRLPRTRSSRRKRVRLMFLPHVAVNQATNSTVATNIMTTIEATNVIGTIANLTIIIETIDAMIMVKATTRMQGTISPTTRRMITSVIISKKRATRPCTMTSPLCQAPAFCLEEGVDLIPDLLHAITLILALAQAAGATKTIMSNNMITSRAQPPNAGVCIPRTMMTDITITRTRAIAFLPPSLLQRQREVIAPRNRESRQQSMNSHNVWIHMKSINSHIVRIHMISMNSHNVWIHMKSVNSCNVWIHMMTWIHLSIWIHIMTWVHLIIWIHMSHYVSLFQIRNLIVWLIVTFN